MSLLRNAVGVFATSIVAMPIGLITSILLARWLLPEQLGVYALTVTIAAVSVPLVHLGLPSAAVFRIRSRAVSPGRAASALLAGTAACGAIAVAFASTVAPFLRVTFFGDRDAVGLGYAVAMIPADMIGMALVAIARGIDRFDIANRYRMVVATVTLGLATTVCLLDVASLEAFLLATLAARALGTTVAAIELAALVRLESFDGRELAAQLRYGWLTYWQTVADRVHEQVDLFMLAALLGPSPEVGIYSVAVSIVDRLRVIPDAIASALFPHLAGLQPTEAGPTAAKATRHSFAGVAATCVAIALLAPLLVPLLYGEAFARSVIPLLLLIPAMAFLTIYFVLARYFMAIARQEVSGITQAVSIAANLSANALLIPVWGAAGAATASLISYSLEGCLCLWMFTRISKQPVAHALLLGAQDVVLLKERLRTAVQRLRGPRIPGQPGPRD